MRKPLEAETTHNESVRTLGAKVPLHTAKTHGGFAGRHDGRGGASTVVFRDAPGNFSYPSRWFVRSTPFAAVCPAPFFDTTRSLAAGDSLTLRYDVVVVDGELGPAECANLASRAAASDLIPNAGND